MKRLIPLFLLLILGLFVGCTKMGSGVSGTPHVVVSIPPYISLVKEIVGDTMTVNSALGPSFDPHTAEATPHQMKMVQNADLFIGVGEGYERKLLSALREGTKEVRILEMDEKFLSFPTLKTPILSMPAKISAFLLPLQKISIFGWDLKV